jgi:hypothetical protein
VWWRCSRDRQHVWQTRVSDRFRDGKVTDCPFCFGRRASSLNSLTTKNPAMARQWHPRRNGTLTPHDITVSSHRRVWWKCSKGPDHEWHVSANSRRTNSGCPFCANRKVSITNVVAKHYPGLVRQWHPTKNGDLTPWDVSRGSTRRIWWRCPKGADHEWQASVAVRTAPDRSGVCPFCMHRRISVTNGLTFLFPRSAHEVAPDQERRASCPGRPCHFTTTRLVAVRFGPHVPAIDIGSHEKGRVPALSSGASVKPRQSVRRPDRIARAAELSTANALVMMAKYTQNPSKLALESPRPPPSRAADPSRRRRARRPWSPCPHRTHAEGAWRRLRAPAGLPRKTPWPTRCLMSLRPSWTCCGSPRRGAAQWVKG